VTRERWKLTHEATIRWSVVIPGNNLTPWPDHLVRVLRDTAIRSGFGLTNVMLCSLEYVCCSLLAVEGNISVVAQARISVLVIRRCVTHRLAALLPIVEAVRYASCTACCRWDRVNRNRANDTHRSEAPISCWSKLHSRAKQIIDDGCRRYHGGRSPPRTRRVAPIR
jgi:hypothetical protein